MKKLWILVLVSLMVGCTPNEKNLTIKLTESIDTIEVNGIYEEQGVIGMYGPSLLDYEVISNTLNLTEVGVYEIVYEVKYGELSKTAKRVITVVDTTPPTLSLKPGIDTVRIGQTWIDSGVEATDNSQKTVSVVVEGHVLNEIGKYEVLYVATDYYGNVSTITRIVHVISK